MNDIVEPWWKRTGRMFLVAVATSASIIFALTLVYGDQQRTEQTLQQELVKLQELTLDATLAEVCVLAIDPMNRNDEAVIQCFIDNGLRPPSGLSREEN